MYPAAWCLSVVQLVISDAHEGLKAAISSVLSGASWQRCLVHFLRNILALVPKRAFPYVLSLVKSIFAQPDRPSAQRQLGQELEGKYPGWSSCSWTRRTKS